MRIHHAAHHRAGDRRGRRELAPREAERLPRFCGKKIVGENGRRPEIALEPRVLEYLFDLPLQVALAPGD